MKAWITICAMVFVAGVVTVLAQETKTNAPAGATPGEAAAPPAVTTTSTIPREVKPPATPASPAPAQPSVTTLPKNSANVHKPVPASAPAVTVTSTPAATAGSEEPPTGESSVPTNAVPGEPETTQTPANTAPASEGTGLGNKGALIIGASILVVAGVVAAFMLRHYRVAPHGSLITSAMAVSKDNEKDDKDDDEDDAQPAEKPVETPVEKKEEKKFPPPMT